eukprot:14372390-Ditylum_brightwellii.AAC.1
MQFVNEISINQLHRSKHPELVEPQVETLQTFPHVPAFMDVNVTASVVKKVARKLLGAAGLDGVDAVTMGDWSLRCGIVSHTLRDTIAKLVRWNWTSALALFQWELGKYFFAWWKKHFVCEWGRSRSSMWSRSTLLRPPGQNRGQNPHNGIAVGGIWWGGWMGHPAHGCMECF